MLSCLRGSRAHAVTVSSFLDVSYDPPTMAVSVYSGARIAESLTAAPRFALSVLTSEQRGIAQWLGQPGQPLYGVLDTVETDLSPAGVPIVAGCLRWVELERTAVHEIATHELVVGEVTAVGAEAPAGSQPLLRWADDYGRPTAR